MFEISQAIEFKLALITLTIVCLTIATNNVSSDQLNERIYYPYKHQVCEQILRTAMYHGKINQLSKHISGGEIEDAENLLKYIRGLTPPNQESIVFVSRDKELENIIMVYPKDSELRDVEVFASYQSIYPEKIYVVVGLK